jgi:hypothetical protein
MPGDKIDAMQRLIPTDRLPEDLVATLSGREVTLWLNRLPSGLGLPEVAKLIGLPWREVLLGESTRQLLDTLSHEADSDLVRRRGYLQLVQTDPSLVSLPPRSLPVSRIQIRRCLPTLASIDHRRGREAGCQEAPSA